MSEAELNPTPEINVDSLTNLRLVKQEGDLVNANWPAIWFGVAASVPDLYRSELAQRALFCDILRGTKICYFLAGDLNESTEMLASAVLEPLIDPITRKAVLNIWSIYASTQLTRGVYEEAVRLLQRLAKELGFEWMVGTIDTRVNLGKAVLQAAKAIPGTVVKQIVEIPTSPVEES